MTNHKASLSPRILSIKWGAMEVENIGFGKDYKLWPGGGRNWDWREHGTDHSAGIQQEDCLELLDNGCEVVVLSRGMFKRLKVPQETLTFLKGKNIEVFVEETKKAIQLYNQFVDEGRAVGGLFHTTC